MIRLSMLGQVFGRWTVLAVADRRALPSGKTVLVYLCRCECGTERSVVGDNLRGGKSQSCGCLHREMVTKHGSLRKQHRAVYNTWKLMRSRCNNPEDPAYRYYGGRGITVDPRWDDFTAFLSDMGERPSPQHSIDRIDNNGNYTKDNCRWALPEVQNVNKRNTVYVGDIPLATLAREHGISYAALYDRIISYGWPLREALSTPVGARRPKGQRVVDGKPLATLAREYGIPYTVLYQRLVLNWNLQDALNRPVRPRRRKLVPRPSLPPRMLITRPGLPPRRLVTRPGLERPCY